MEKNQQRMEIMWGTRILDEGFTPIPNLLIRQYRKLGIEHGEWGLICTILTYKHDTRDPYPSEETLASDLQCSTRQIRKWISSLKEKGFVWVGRRRNTISKKWGNNVYNFKPLIDAALKLIGEFPLPESNDDFEIEWKNKPQAQEVPNGPEEQAVPLDPGPEVPLGSDLHVPLKKKSKKENRKINGWLGKEKSSQNNSSSEDKTEQFKQDWKLLKEVCEKYGINQVQALEFYKVWRHYYQDAPITMVIVTLRELLNDKITLSHGRWTEQEYRNITGLFHHRMKAWREMAVVYEEIDGQAYI